MALIERDQIIHELTDSLKQSINIRDQLHEQGERLTNEVKHLRAAASRSKWLSVENATEAIGQRLSETTIDLVSESEYDDDEYYNRPTKMPFQLETTPAIEERKTQIVESISLPQTSIEEFKKRLTKDELTLFSHMQNKFNEFLHQELDTINKSYEQELHEKNEKDAEVNRLRQLLVNTKTGSTEVKELRNELDTIHKKEMEDLRMYFERKCSDLEKQ